MCRDFPGIDLGGRGGRVVTVSEGQGPLEPCVFFRATQEGSGNVPEGLDEV